ncbi:hypothetical protein GLOTRDRAFT_109880 [Gloeophyllum trabeum ATCC 11539]|uniref:Uncharacterized protein n=1 Tax=Gloeophyllum trabeum (strain ATCC 11539 / FP-39264 / Madison 617) TaxID=670483 RepID=S7RSU4_GLOTA|nr:uncharacterized protein GLOTRDRAFT_109880 [Gloeophyllum trabeum ATCC 11539]EPQ57750.1 hypothetical protein GLOTRDRAFT_109880 [Gloeophyllum trabeum ATCC 11539]
MAMYVQDDMLEWLAIEETVRLRESSRFNRIRGSIRQKGARRRQLSLASRTSSMHSHVG